MPNFYSSPELQPQLERETAKKPAKPVMVAERPVAKPQSQNRDVAKTDVMELIHRDINNINEIVDIFVDALHDNNASTSTLSDTNTVKTEDQSESSAVSRSSGSERRRRERQLNTVEIPAVLKTNVTRRDTGDSGYVEGNDSQFSSNTPSIISSTESWNCAPSEEPEVIQEETPQPQPEVEPTEPEKEKEVKLRKKHSLYLKEKHREADDVSEYIPEQSSSEVLRALNTASTIVSMANTQSNEKRLETYGAYIDDLLKVVGSSDDALTVFSASTHARESVRMELDNQAYQNTLIEEWKRKDEKTDSNKRPDLATAIRVLHSREISSKQFKNAVKCLVQRQEKDTPYRNKHLNIKYKINKAIEESGNHSDETFKSLIEKALRKYYSARLDEGIARENDAQYYMMNDFFYFLRQRSSRYVKKHHTLDKSENSILGPKFFKAVSAFRDTLRKINSKNLKDPDIQEILLGIKTVLEELQSLDERHSKRKHQASELRNIVQDIVDSSKADKVTEDQLKKLKAILDRFDFKRDEKQIQIARSALMEFMQTKLIAES